MSNFNFKKKNLFLIYFIKLATSSLFFFLEQEFFLKIENIKRNRSNKNVQIINQGVRQGGAPRRLEIFKIQFISSTLTFISLHNFGSSFKALPKVKKANKKLNFVS